MRDDFNIKTKDTMAKRVGFRCSNPNCRQLTCGPQETETKVINIGIASHITAASSNGPRYNKSITKEERKSIENGIWLCQNCAKLIDSDSIRYSENIIHEWKKLSEKAALVELEFKDDKIIKDDIDLIKSYMQFFDRPAFQHPFYQEGSMEAFDKAIEDTIIALNTGSLRSRDGSVLNVTKGKSYIENYKWRENLNLIVELLIVIRDRYALAIRSNEIHINNQADINQFYCISNKELTLWFDSTRQEILSIFLNVCTDAGIKYINRFPRYRREW